MLEPGLFLPFSWTLKIDCEDILVAKITLYDALEVKLVDLVDELGESVIIYETNTLCSMDSIVLDCFSKWKDGYQEQFY